MVHQLVEDLAIGALEAEENDVVGYWNDLSDTDWFRQHPILSATTTAKPHAINNV